MVDEVALKMWVTSSIVSTSLATCLRGKQRALIYSGDNNYVFLFYTAVTEPS